MSFRLFPFAVLLLSATLIASCSSESLPTGQDTYTPGAVEDRGLPVSTPSAQGIDAGALANAYSYVESSPELSPYALSLLVVRHEYLVAERYYGGDGPETGIDDKSEPRFDRVIWR